MHKVSTPTMNWIGMSKCKYPKLPQLPRFILLIAFGMSFVFRRRFYWARFSMWNCHILIRSSNKATCRRLRRLSGDPKSFRTTLCLKARTRRWCLRSIYTEKKKSILLRLNRTRESLSFLWILLTTWYQSRRKSSKSLIARWFST